jgi:hypothetical protein
VGESSDIPSTSSKIVFKDELMVHFSDKESLDYSPLPIRDKEREGL